jgi:transcriptional regulator with XRE-family HTH domain
MSTGASDEGVGDLARRIVQRRNELGLTCEQLAVRAGMDAGYLHYFEQSSDAVLTSGALFRLAAALETTTAALAGRDVGRPPGPGRAGPHPVLESLTREECEARLRAGGVGRVVFTAERGPVALPMNFRLVGGRVVFRTDVGAANTVSAASTVGFEVDRIDEAMSEGWSVLVSGRAHRVEDTYELKRISSAGVEPWAGGELEDYVAIDIDELSGRILRQKG